jgi:hypothetical protein
MAAGLQHMSSGASPQLIASVALSHLWRRRYHLRFATRAIPADAGPIDEALPERHELLEGTAETYLALADRLDVEIAVLEAASRLARPATDVDFEGLLDQAERKASRG